MNDVKVDADDGSGHDGQGAPEQAAPERGPSAAHGATGGHSTRGRTSRPARSKPASRPGTGADSGFADADEAAMPPEAAAAIKEAEDLQQSAGQAAGPGNAAPDTTAPQGAAPQQGTPPQQGATPGGPVAPAQPRGVTRPRNPVTDQSNNQKSTRRAARAHTPRSMPVSFFNGGPVVGNNTVPQSSRLMLHTSAGTSPERTVTLECSPPGGTHPKAAEACADVAKSGGDLAQMPTNANPRACFMIYSPVTVTAQGQWKGQAVRYTKQFPNTCMMRDKTGSVFDF